MLLCSVCSVRYSYSIAIPTGDHTESQHAIFYEHGVFFTKDERASTSLAAHSAGLSESAKP